jgi:inhibitor of cysteine peptidase
MVEAKQGDKIVLSLQENITTGYGWQIEEIDRSIVELESTEYVDAPQTGLGAGGTRTFRFRAHAVGSARIQLRLRRPWEDVDATVKHFDVTVRVQAP